MPGSSPRLATLRQLLAERFPAPARRSEGLVPTGVAPADAALGGGLAAGLLTEVVSAAPSSGGQLLLAGLLAATRTARRRVALVDAADAFSPDAVPPDALRHLVWVRCAGLEPAFAATDLLARDGNYAAVVLDLRGLAERTLRRHPATAWFRLQRAIEGGPSALLVHTPFPLVPSAPWRLVLGAAQPLASRRLPREQIAAALEVGTGRARQAEGERKAG